MSTAALLAARAVTRRPGAGGLPSACDLSVSVDLASPAGLPSATDLRSTYLPAGPHAAPECLPFRCGEARPTPPGTAPPTGAYPTEKAIRWADVLAVCLARAHDRLAAPLARAAAGFCGHTAWTDFGARSLDDHARERFGRSGRWVRDLAALGRALPALPGLERALAGDDGERPLGLVRAQLIGGIASADSLAAWLAVARRVSVRELKEVVGAARAAGSSWPPGLAQVEGEPPAGSGEPPSGARGGGGPLVPEEARVAAPEVAAPSISDGGASDDPGDPDNGSLIRLLVPEAVAAAFEEALELFRALAGGEATVTSFIDALVGDALAGPHPPDIEAVPLRHGPSIAQVESALARSTGHWAHLAPAQEVSWNQALSGLSLLRLEELALRAGTGGPAELEGQIRELVGLQDRLEVRLNDTLAMMGDLNAWSRLRFDGTAHYAEERLGMSRSSVRARIRAARGLRAACPS